MVLRIGLAPRRTALLVCGVLALLALTGLTIAYSGAYSVAASGGHAPWMDWLLRVGMQHSVATHSRGIEVPSLDSPDLVALGAGHFHNGCAVCHGRPGAPRNPIHAHMLPAPPDIGPIISTWSSAELFWITRHGIKYTGMPAWSGDGRDDEVWSVVAFLERLPELDEAEYHALAFGNAPPPSTIAGPRLHDDAAGLLDRLCARCHDTRTAPTTSRHVPRLGGQSRAYLTVALEQYRAGTRESGIMEPIAVELGDADIAALATLYADLRSPARKARDAIDDVLRRGRDIAENGVAAAGLPPCDACHGPEALALYPRLAGLAAEYATGQLQLWRRGGRNETALGAIMGVIAERLDEAQIEAVTRHYERLDPSERRRP